MNHQPEPVPAGKRSHSRSASVSPDVSRRREIVISATIILSLLVFLIVATVFVILNAAGILRITWMPKSSAVFITILVPVLAAMVPLLQWLFALIESRHKTHLLPAVDTERVSPETPASPAAVAAPHKAALPRQDWETRRTLKPSTGASPKSACLSNGYCRKDVAWWRSWV